MHLMHLFECDTLYTCENITVLMVKTKHIMAKIFLFAKVTKLPVIVPATF